MSLFRLDPSLASCTPRLEWDIMYEYDNTNGNKMLNVAYEEADRSWRVAEEDGKEIAVTYQTPIPFNVRISGNLIFAREPGIGMTGFSTKISPGIRKVFLVEVVTCGHFSFKLSHFKPMEYDRDGRTPHRNMDVNTRRKGELIIKQTFR